MANQMDPGADAMQRFYTREAARVQPQQDWTREIQPAQGRGGQVQVSPMMPAQGQDLGATPWLPTGEILGYPAFPGGMPGELRPSAPPSQAGELNMTAGVPREAVLAPMSREENFQGSMKGLLSQNVGHYIVATFLVGTQSPVSWEGFLHEVGNDYLVIFQPDQGRYITGDFYSLKFVEFHDSAGVVPSCPGYRRRDGQQMW
ncbi:MAG: hypothetical protein PHD67_11115 [Oscillospiraceae bacterium]|nr:hypothetical protein [Oscillospiraceae bacterium]